MKQLVESLVHLFNLLKQFINSNGNAIEEWLFCLKNETGPLIFFWDHRSPQSCLYVLDMQWEALPTCHPFIIDTSTIHSSITMIVTMPMILHVSNTNTQMKHVIIVIKEITSTWFFGHTFYSAWWQTNKVSTCFSHDTSPLSTYHILPICHSHAICTSSNLPIFWHHCNIINHL